MNCSHRSHRSRHLICVLCHHCNRQNIRNKRRFVRSTEVVFFAFFYTAVVFNPQETADNLRKYGGFILGIRPGAKTAEFIDYVLTRITVVGAIYLAVVCVFPEFLTSVAGVQFTFGGTSLLIAVSVMMDTVAQIQSHLIAQQYEGLIKKAKLRGATTTRGQR